MLFQTQARLTSRPIFALEEFCGFLLAGLRRTIASFTRSKMRSRSTSQPSFFAMQFVV